MKEPRRGKVVKDTTTVAYAATDLSPREAGAGQLNALLRRHWMAENGHHYVRDNHWREDRATWRTGNSAFVMFVLLAIGLFPVADGIPALAGRDANDAPLTRRGLYCHGGR